MIEAAANEISKLREKRLVLQKQQLKFEAEVGPIKYIADLVYGDKAKEKIDEAVRGVIILLVVVFDPLAILLIVAAGGIDVVPAQSKIKTKTPLFAGRSKRRIRKGTERFEGDAAEIVSGEDWETTEKVKIQKEK
ncbi:MAG: hypothetical protein VW270_05300 [Candidatus Poseidoniales archaeon]